MSDHRKDFVFHNRCFVWDALVDSTVHLIAQRHTIPPVVEAHARDRLREGINMTIMLNAAVIVEGYLREKLLQFVYHKFPGSNDIDAFQARIKEDIEKQIGKATLERLERLSPILVGNATWQTVREGAKWPVAEIREIRNFIAHGNSIDTSIGTKEDGKLDVKYCGGRAFVAKAIENAGSRPYIAAVFNDKNAITCIRSALGFILRVEDVLLLEKVNKIGRLSGLKEVLEKLPLE